MQLRYFRRFNDIDINYIYTDKHIHSNWTDGKATIAQMARQAQKLGLRQIAVTDHMRAESTYFSDYSAEVEAVNSRFNIEILAGFEAKIKNFAGDMDVSVNITEKAQVKVASIHRFPVDGRLCLPSEFKKKMCQEIELQLSLAAIKRKAFNVLGHAGGMSLKAYNEFPLDFFEKIISACGENNIAFEINSGYHLPVLQKLKILLKRYNVFVSLGSDSHSVEDLENSINILKDLIADE